MLRSIWRRRAARRDRDRRRDEYSRRVALGEPALRAAGQLLAMEPSRPPDWDGEPTRTLVALEGGKGNPRRQGAVYVYGRGDAPRKDVVA